MTIISRMKLDHPALATAGGSALHTQIETIYTSIGDHVDSRFFTKDALADSASEDFDHNFKTAFADLTIDLYLRDTGTGELTAITDSTSPALSAFTIAATPSFLTTKVRVTNNSGSSRDIAVVVSHSNPFAKTARTFSFAPTAPEWISSTDAQGLRSNTSDGSDSKSVILAGGGAYSKTRGGFVQAYGNEVGTQGGRVLFTAGDASTAAGANAAFRWASSQTAGGASVDIASATGRGGWTFGSTSGTTDGHTMQSQSTSTYVLSVKNSNATADTSNGLTINAGTSANDYPLWVTNNSGGTLFGACNGLGSWTIGTPTGSSLTHVIQGGNATSGPRLNLLSNHASSGNTEFRMGRPSDFFFKIFTDGNANGGGDVSLLALKATGSFNFYTGGDAASNLHGSISSTGVWTLGEIAASTITHTAYGYFRVRNSTTSGTQLGAPSVIFAAPQLKTATPSGAAQTYEGGRYGGLYLVRGYGTGDNAGRRFQDLVWVGESSSWTSSITVLATTTINSPGTRTYAVDAGGQFSVAMGAGGTGGYEVSVVTVGNS